MGKIYQGAEEVIVWLGVASDDSDRAIEILTDDWLIKFSDLNTIEQREQRAIVALCHRPYWRRV